MTPSLRLTCVVSASGMEPAATAVIVVLARDLDRARLQVLHRVVGAVVPERQLVRGPAERSRQELVAEADPEDGDAADQVGDGGRRTGQGGRIARAVGEEYAVRLERQHVGRGGAGGHDGHGAERAEQPRHRRLHAEVVGDDTQVEEHVGGVAPQSGVRGGGGRGHAGHQVEAVGTRGGGRGRPELAFWRGAERGRARRRRPARALSTVGCRLLSGRARRGVGGTTRSPRSPASSKARRRCRIPRCRGSAESAPRRRPRWCRSFRCACW